MFYKQNKNKVLDESLFKNPTSEYRGTPFWSWNTKLSDEMLLKQIEYFKDMGMGGFYMHVRTGMETAYLSDEFMHFVKLCNNRAKELGMYCWLYDEDRWSSGSAGGQVSKDFKLRARFLMLTQDNFLERNDFFANYEEFCRLADEGKRPHGYFMAKYGIKLDANGYLSEYKQIGLNEQYDGDVWYAFMYAHDSCGWYNGESYIDTLNKAAVEKFRDTTHEAYFKNVGEDFGKSIHAIFTDEPQVSRRSYLENSTDKNAVILAFTDDFDATYKAAYGDSILEKLPELVWEKKNNGCAKTRYNYMDHISHCFSTSFAGTLGEWCDAHNIALAGHMMEEPTLHSQSDSLGEAMRNYRSFKIPGIDMLCDRMEYTTAKQVNSAVRQYGREAMISELYGVTGWDYGFNGHKRQGDWQAALGVTLRVHHLAWASMRGEAKRDYPASIFYQSPWYKQYNFIEDHFARLNTALTRGKSMVRVGVIHPIESFWMYCGPNDKTGAIRNELDWRFTTLTEALCNSGIDFDFIAESLLPELCEKASNPLKVGQCAYDCVVVPGVKTLRRTTLERLTEFAKAGGKVILMGDAPEYIDACVCSDGINAAKNWVKIENDNNAVINALEDYRFVEFTNLDKNSRENTIVHQVRIDGEDKWLFFCHGNDISKTENFDPSYAIPLEVALDGEFEVLEYDTLTGNIYTPTYTHKNGKTVITRKMFAQDSTLLKLIPKSEKPSAPAKPQIKLDGKGIRFNGNVEYTLDEPNAILLDMAQYAFDDDEYSHEKVDSIIISDMGRTKFYAQFGDQSTVQPWVPEPKELKNDKGHILKRRFTFNTEIELDHTKLALEEAETAKISINGKPIDVVIDGYYVDESIKTVKLPNIPKGEVVVEIEIPFFLRGRSEWCYVLGDFGVKVENENVTAVPRVNALEFSSITNQTLPFYTGNITYHTTVNLESYGERTLQTKGFGGAAIKVSVDGIETGIIATAPYALPLGNLNKGEHKIDITVFGTRYNGFGPLHNANDNFGWWGPESWRIHNTDMWTNNYNLHKSGLTEAPVIY